MSHIREVENAPIVTAVIAEASAATSTAAHVELRGGCGDMGSLDGWSFIRLA